MKTTDLRIGNYIYSDGRVMQIGPYNMMYLCKHTDLEKEGYSPIPLDSSWLERGRFILMDDDGDFRGNDRYWVRDKFPGCITLPRFKFNYTDRPIEFVHNLQNLFFELSGQDLVFAPLS